MIHNLPEIYEFYSQTGGELEYSVFSELCQEFNQRVMDEVILEGDKFDMGSYMSTLSIGRLDRNYANKQIDWKASHQLKKELIEEGVELYDPETGQGKKWFVYYTDDWYCRFYWNKFHAKITNKTVYRFTATRGIKGNKTKLSTLLAEDELAYLRFEKLKG